jgi:hypothetical protein
LLEAHQRHGEEQRQADVAQHRHRAIEHPIQPRQRQAKLWELASLALPMIIILAVQAVAMALYAVFVTYRTSAPWRGTATG